LAAGGFWFVCPDEGAEELVIHLGSDRVHVNVRLREELPGIFYAVNAPRLDRCILEPSARQLGDVLALFERASDTANPEQHALANNYRHATAHDHIGNCEPSAWLQHTEGFTENAIFVG
jgi:hypothetical protein